MRIIHTKCIVEYLELPARKTRYFSLQKLHRENALAPFTLIQLRQLLTLGRLRENADSAW